MAVATERCPPLVSALISAYADVDSIAAVGFLSVVVSACAYGVTCCQTFYYYRSEKARVDGSALKMGVAALMTICSLQEGLIIHGAFYYLVDNGGNPCIFLQKVVWSLPAEALLSVPIHVGVEGFLIHRAWKIGHNNHVAGACAAMIVTTSVLITLFMVKIWLTPSVVTSLLKLRRIGLAAAAAVGIADTLITFSMFWYLRRSRTAVSRTNDMLTKLMIVTVSTGALSSLVTLAELVSYALDTRHFFVVFFNFLAGKMYLNSLLTSLNLRSVIQQTPQDGSAGAVNSIHLDRFNDAPRSTGGHTLYPGRIWARLTAIVCHSQRR